MIKSWMLCVAFFSLGVVGCGAPPSTPMTVDAGPADVAVTTTDVPVVADNGPVTDNGTTPADAVDAGAPAVCIPRENSDGTQDLCAGATLCRPNATNPTCAGAMDCNCGMTAADMPSAICTPETMPSCTTAVTCTVGHNHCSVHLPAGVDYAPFTMLEASPLRRGGLRYTRDDGWISTDRMRELMFVGRPQPVFDSRGFVQVCVGMPLDQTVTASMRDFVACAPCSGHTCYWNRGPASSSSPSFEVDFREDACGLQLRIYRAGATSPDLVQDMSSMSATHC